MFHDCSLCILLHSWLLNLNTLLTLYVCVVKKVFKCLCLFKEYEDFMETISHSWPFTHLITESENIKKTLYEVLHMSLWEEVSFLWWQSATLDLHTSYFWKWKMENFVESVTYEFVRRDLFSCLCVYLCTSLLGVIIKI